MTDASAPRPNARRFIAAPRALLRALIESEASGGLVLMAVAALALVVANSGAGPAYFAALEARVAGMTVQHWVNDALMAVFFLLVGLEIKREMAEGELATWPARALPGIAALGGMAVPALIYAAVNAGHPDTLRGWAIPAATDIAFALGVLTLLGPRVPLSLKVFLTALAILDDLGAVAIIAVFYTADLSWPMLGLAAAGIGVLAAMNRFGIRHLWPYLAVGAGVWLAVLHSGVHATLAGVALALAIPMRSRAGEESCLHRLEHALQPWVAYLIVPVFGFANAGVSLAGMSPATLADAVPLGIALGLFAGKQLGVLGATWAAIRAGVATLPSGASWASFYGVAILCGIGFTMSLFIGDLAFRGRPMFEAEMKVGILAGSILSALVGAAVLRAALSGPARR